MSKRPETQPENSATPEAVSLPTPDAAASPFVETLARLAHLTEALSEAQQAANIAQVVVEQGIVTVGARAGCIALLGEAGDVLEVAHIAGYTDAIHQNWRQFPLAANLPASEVVRTGEACFFEHGDAFRERYPALSSAINKNGDASAALPLKVGERTVGAIYFTFDRTRGFSELDRSLMQLLARQCADALERSRLAAIERAARREAEARAKRVLLLAEASELLYDAGLNYEETLRTIARMTVPRYADWCTVDVLDAGGSLQRLAVEHVDPAKVELAWEAHRCYPPSLDEPQGIARVLRTGESVYSFGITDEMLASVASNDDYLRLIRSLGLTGAIIVPLVAGDKVLGALTLISTNESGRVFTQDDVALAKEIGRRAGLAMENARLYRAAQEAEARQRRIAETLQQSILIRPGADDFPGVRLATLYEAAWDEAELGGDFYDAFALDEGRVALVVGDVTGKGLAAAAFTAEVKFALRTILREDGAADRALERLNRFLCDAQRLDARSPYSLVSLTLAVLDSQSGDLHCAAAGAEPPLILRAETGEREEISAFGPLLGAYPDARYESLTVRLGVGDDLLMVTDGITEARRGRSFFGIDGVAGAASAAMSEPCAAVEAVADAIIRAAKEFAGSKLRDDACILIACRRDGGDAAV